MWSSWSGIQVCLTSRRTLLDDADDSYDATGGGQSSVAPAATEGDRQLFTVRSWDERLEGSSFPVGSIAAQLPSPTTDRIPLSVASERTGWTADRVLYRGRTVVLKVKVSPDLIAGDVDEGYGKVADVFRRNLTSGQEVGAAVAVYRDGVKVVDLWGGFRNGITKAPWEEDTLALMFSTTKGVSALAVAVAASQGLISYDARVADYWPEFAQAAKGPITVRQLLSHQAGLPVLDQAPTLDDVSDPAKLSAMLAAQAPAWTPGSRHGYHAVTLGWYESELIRHADPAGRSLGQFFADEVATPLGLDFHIGLPASVDRDRVAHLHCWSHAEMMLHLNVLPMRFVAAMFNPRSLTSRAVIIPKGLTVRRLQPRRLPCHRDTRLERYRYRAVGGQSLRVRGNGRFRSRHHP